MVNQLVWAYLLATNATSLFLIGFDKLSARMNSERVPEVWFFLASVAGGFLGVLVGMLVFHHKTRKTNFQVKIAVATGLGALMIALLALRI